MTPEEDDHDASAAVTPDQAARLLGIARHGPRRPVDDLIDRLRRPDGGAWFERTLDGFLGATLSETAHALERGRIGTIPLVAAKEAAKTRMVNAPSREAALEATACYFGVVASALAHFGEVITSRGREELDPLLIDLSDAAPPGWSSVFRRAAEAA